VNGRDAGRWVGEPVKRGRAGLVTPCRQALKSTWIASQNGVKDVSDAKGTHGGLLRRHHTGAGCARGFRMDSKQSSGIAPRASVGMGNRTTRASFGAIS
jgi:hypothetical protein